MVKYRVIGYKVNLGVNWIPGKNDSIRDSLSFLELVGKCVRKDCVGCLIFVRPFQNSLADYQCLVNMALFYPNPV